MDSKPNQLPSIFLISLVVILIGIQITSLVLQLLPRNDCIYAVEEAQKKNKSM